MRSILLLLIGCIVVAGIASAAYSPAQQAMYDGTQISWKMAVAYTSQDINTYNTLVDQWNAWVQTNFGPDPALLMNKINAPLDLTKPIVIRNNTTSGVLHKIDGMSQTNRTIPTNDANLLTWSELNASRKSNPGTGDGYLPAP
jgi:hypothetical protein